MSGGNIIDADWVRAPDQRPGVNPIPGQDALSEIYVYLNNTFPRQAVYRALSTHHPSRMSDPAEIMVNGQDSDNARILVTTTYRLPPRAAYVQIDTEVRRLLMDAYERAKLLLRRNVAALHRVAEALLERESLDGAEIDEIVQSLGGAAGPAAATA